MGGLGTYIGLDSLLRGELTMSAAQQWHLLPCRRPSFLFYFLSCLFLVSGTGLLSYCLYLCVV